MTSSITDREGRKRCLNERDEPDRIRAPRRHSVARQNRASVDSAYLGGSGSAGRATLTSGSAVNRLAERVRVAVARRDRDTLSGPFESSREGGIGNETSTGPSLALIP
jgi:hypothetical protein